MDLQTSSEREKYCNYLQDVASLGLGVVPMTLKEDMSEHVSYASIDMRVLILILRIVLSYQMINLPTPLLEERSPVSRRAV